MTTIATKLLLAASLLLAGCAGAGSTVYNTEFADQFRFPGALTLGGTRAVEMHGTPPAGLSPAQFAALMRVPGWYQPTRFRVATPDERPDAFRFVTAFGTDVNVALCTRPRYGADPALISMAVCNGGTLISRAAVRMAPGEEVNRAVGHLMVGLLPAPRPADRPCLVPGRC
jgi:hypothetical protein